MSSKIKIKMGPIEVECEGTEQFLKKELPDILQAVSDLYDQSGAKAAPGSVESGGGGDAGAERGNTGNESGIVGTTATLAGKLGSKNAGDLIIAAAAHLTFVGGNDEFGRKELLSEIKGASGYYKESMSKNLTNYLNNRVKAGDLLEPKTGYYALDAKKREELRAKLNG